MVWCKFEVYFNVEGRISLYFYQRYLARGLHPPFYVVARKFVEKRIDEQFERSSTKLRRVGFHRAEAEEGRSKVI